MGRKFSARARFRVGECRAVRPGRARSALTSFGAARAQERRSAPRRDQSSPRVLSKAFGASAPTLPVRRVLFVAMTRLSADTAKMSVDEREQELSLVAERLDRFVALYAHASSGHYRRTLTAMCVRARSGERYARMSRERDVSLRYSPEGNVRLRGVRGGAEVGGGGGAVTKGSRAPRWGGGAMRGARSTNEGCRDGRECAGRRRPWARPSPESPALRRLARFSVSSRRSRALACQIRVASVEWLPRSRLGLLSGSDSTRGAECRVAGASPRRGRSGSPKLEGRRGRVSPPRRLRCGRLQGRPGPRLRVCRGAVAAGPPHATGKSVR